METVVQIIEGAWYVWIAYALKGLKNDTIAGRRYMDWVITTPVILIQTVLLMAYYMKNEIPADELTIDEINEKLSESFSLNNTDPFSISGIAIDSFKME